MAMLLHARADADSVAAFLRPYVGGLGVRLAFLAVLAAALPMASPALACALAALAGAATLTALVVLPALRRWLRIRGGSARTDGGTPPVIAALPEQAGSTRSTSPAEAALPSFVGRDLPTRHAMAPSRRHH